MAEHKYSLVEIDRMRACLQFICRDREIAENQLRTYMLNGTTPEELAYADFLEVQRRMAATRDLGKFIYTRDMGKMFKSC